MASHRGTRQHIVAFLTEQGPIDDPTGRATSKLKSAVSYGGSPAGFSQMLAAMERSGDITRTMKGKRTFRIGLGASHERAGADTAEQTDAAVAGEAAELDYDRLAESLLLRAVEAVAAGARPAADGESWARRRLERLERRNAELEQALSRAKAEARGLAQERDALKQQLEHTAGNLALLTDRLESRSMNDRVSRRLASDERELLQQLRRTSPGGRGSQVG